MIMTGEKDPSSCSEAKRNLPQAASVQEDSRDNPNNIINKKGVRLKHFEQVLTKLLPHVEPRYIPLPGPPPPTDNNSITTTAWPHWDDLPPGARVYGYLSGQLSNPQLAQRKEDQVTSILHCIFAFLPEKLALSSTTPTTISSSYTIVDFGGGSGHVSLPLAYLLPQCTIVVVDLKQTSLDLLQEKARECVQNNNKKTNVTSTSTNNSDASSCSPPGSTPTAIPNLRTFAGDIQSYTGDFDLGVALHVCGEATDVVLRKCAANKAHIVAAPCCVGKLNRNSKDPYIYHATAQNTPTILYPQSRLFQKCLFVPQDNNKHTQRRQNSKRVKQQQNDNAATGIVSDSSNANKLNNHKTTIADDWDALAKAADYCHELDMNDRRNASRRTAKGVLEMDRQLFLQEQYPYKVVLTRMHPLTASPKHDILLAYYDDDNSGEDRNQSQQHVSPRIASLLSSEAMEDQVVSWTKDYLLYQIGTADVKSRLRNHKASPSPGGATKVARLEARKDDGVDWTLQEEEEIRNELQKHFPGPVREEAGPSSPSSPSSTVVSNEHKVDEGGNSAEGGGTFVFPTGMGGRKRKLIHFVAEAMGLAHYGVGKKNSDKTVAVRRRIASNRNKI